MTIMNKEENVKAQYADDEKLSVRIKLHAKHSTNKQGFFPWLFEQYAFHENDRILELGCGNGAQWEGQISGLPKGCTLLLSDLSQGMLDGVVKKYAGHENVSFERIDIQDIGYPDESFDIVIANQMLYHVPDIDKGLSEVSRVLKRGGTFYASTNGNGGMRPFLHDALRRIDLETTAFTELWAFSMQNGAEMLRRYFIDVKRVERRDSLSVTETQDLIDWIKSTISSCSETQADALYSYFEEMRVKEGAINIEKEGCLFVCVK